MPGVRRGHTFRGTSSTSGGAPESSRRVSAAALFLSPVLIPPGPRQQVPLEALLLQIEKHVRLEQAAAESFLESPTPSLLHSRTDSPLVN
jgi:hypothetical protein